MISHPMKRSPKYPHDPLAEHAIATMFPELWKRRQRARLVRRVAATVIGGCVAALVIAFAYAYMVAAFRT